jgi:hypothetical protein
MPTQRHSPDRQGNVVHRERFMVGPRAHILKNRFYIGEVVYRGSTSRGEHPAIVDPEVLGDFVGRGEETGRRVETGTRRARPGRRT